VALFGALGGNHKTVVFAVDKTSVGGTFRAVAIFPIGEINIQVSLDTKPSSFDADFPQALYVDAFDAV
jgi:hypothetical protein